MSTAQGTTTANIAPAPILVLHLWGEPGSECGICEEYGPHRHAVGWYCGPVKEDIGQPVPEWARMPSPEEERSAGRATIGSTASRRASRGRRRVR